MRDFQGGLKRATVIWWLLLLTFYITIDVLDAGPLVCVPLLCAGEEIFPARLYMERQAGLAMIKRKTGCLLFVFCAAVLMGCGDGEAVHTSAGIKTAQEESSGEENPGEGQEDSEAEESKEAPEENPDTETKQEQDEAAAVDGSFMAPVEMDETLRNQLAEEMLQENEMDTSVVESAPVTKGCSFTLPEAFSESEDIEGMYVTRRYPIDASTIYYVALGGDVALQLMTEETFKAQAEANFLKEYGEEIKVHIDSFERIRIDGCPAFRILCHYQMGDTQISQLEYAINADKSYVITYSQTSDYDRMEEYEASAETIHLEF